MSPANRSLHSNLLVTPPRDISPTPSLDSAKSGVVFTPARNASGASPLVRSPSADTLAERFEGLDVDMEDAQPPSPEQTPSPLPKPVELEEWSKPSVESRKSLPTVDPRSKLYPFVLPPGL
ncbi:hypothetical protein I350_07609 [Cryptococcus amylolentus CBS 6273]|uniref:Uncharacterized protein n=1 Tax=Cryptococcus amylolentus CBS 6273 TaxID=1296118 RepID=A0A1E3JAU9_9TREE|nr:hypothetical protein I350_07609 [Cryptococcus amylolentus CBS 6273]